MSEKTKAIATKSSATKKKTVAKKKPAAKKKVAAKKKAAIKSKPSQVSTDSLIKMESLESVTPDKVSHSLHQKKVEDVISDAPQESANCLSLTISNSLHKKLKSQAMEEGISLEDFVTELLAESVVLRAWEIVERKNQMRSTPNQNPNQRSGNNSGNTRNRKGRMSHGRYQNIMDDKASFLEYVRNQERSRR